MIDRPNAGLGAVAKAYTATTTPREEIALQRAVDRVGYTRWTPAPSLSPLLAMASSGVMIDAAHDLADAGGPGIRRRKALRLQRDALERYSLARAALYGPTNRSSVVTM